MLPRIDFKLFMDRPAVAQAVSRGAKRALSKGGAWVRQVARRSIRKRKRVSKPSAPPASHAGDYKRSIFFGYEPTRETVVIGPRVDYGPAASNVPELLEFGGAAIDWRTGERVTYEDRPHMGPAMESSEGKIAEFWRDAVQ